ncbi:MAG TPA: hypothetical protein VM619_04175 [Luteimonas sp.]|nr:hypothetical protein [Luteimonas sp.]
MTMHWRAALALLAGLAFACVAVAQEAAPADPEVWGVYATLAGQERQQAGSPDTYLMRWRWIVPGARMREEYVVPSSGNVAHYNEITPGAQPGMLHLKATYLGGKEWNGTLDADGTVRWVGKGLFKLRYFVGPGPDGAVLYGMEGRAPTPLVLVGAETAGATAAAAPAAGSTAPAASPAQAAAPAALALASTSAPAATPAATDHAAQAAALEAQARELRAVEATAAAQRKAAEAAGQATLAALQAEVQVKAAAAAAAIEAQLAAQPRAGDASSPPATQAADAQAEAAAQATARQAAMQPTATQQATVQPDRTASQSPAQHGAQAGAMPPSAASTPVSMPVAAAAPEAAPTPVAPSPTDGFTAGTYMLDGGSYVIEVQRDGDGLLVVEPNKRSPYAWQGGRDFHFHNPNTDTTYGIRVVDARTIEAFKPFQAGNVPSRLVLVGAATGTAQETLGDPAFEAIAEKYAAMIEQDPANTQAWAACAGAALKYGNATREDADAYARQVIAMLRLMDTQATPCEDALPSRLW